MLLRIACCALGHKHELSMKHEQEQELKQSLVDLLQLIWKLMCYRGNVTVVTQRYFP